MGMARDRTQIEARLSAKTANLADLNAQRLLAPPAFNNDGISSVGNGNDDGDDDPTPPTPPNKTPAGDYDKLEEKLIKKLKELVPTEARDQPRKAN